MNWEAIGSIGEIVGAIAVVVTLAYLAAQTRLNMRALRASAYEDIYRDLQQNLLALDPGLFQKAYEGGALSQHEVFILNRWRVIMFRMYENWWKQHQNRILDDDVFVAYCSHMRFTLSLQGSIEWWRTGRPIDYIPEFIRHVERKIEEWEMGKGT